MAAPKPSWSPTLHSSNGKTVIPNSSISFRILPQSARRDDFCIVCGKHLLRNAGERRLVLGCDQGCQTTSRDHLGMSVTLKKIASLPFVTVKSSKINVYQCAPKLR